MPTLLVVHHTPAPSLQNCLEHVLAGAQNVIASLDTASLDTASLDTASPNDAPGLEVLLKPALVATPIDVLRADAIALGTPANIGYMSGALKHFFDQIYYPTLSACEGLPWGLYVHGNDDCAGATRAVERIAGGLSWAQVGQPVTITGEVTPADTEALVGLGENLGAAALGLLPS